MILVNRKEARNEMFRIKSIRERIHRIDLLAAS